LVSVPVCASGTSGAKAPPKAAANRSAALVRILDARNLSIGVKKNRIFVCDGKKIEGERMLVSLRSHQREPTFGGL
jgi:hypothetical protein